MSEPDARMAGMSVDLVWRLNSHDIDPPTFDWLEAVVLARLANHDIDPIAREFGAWFHNIATVDHQHGFDVIAMALELAVRCIGISQYQHSVARHEQTVRTAMMFLRGQNEAPTGSAPAHTDDPDLPDA